MATSTVQREIEKTANDAVELAKTTADTVQKTVTETASGLRETSERVFLAGLGAFVLVEEKGSQLFDELVRKGRKAQLPELSAPLKQVRQRLDEGAEAVTGRARDARYVATEAADKVEDRLQNTVAAAMKRLGVPTKEEIDALTASVERLNERLVALKKERARQPEVSFTMEAVGGGWYEIAVDGVVVEKVQGKEEAEAALARLAEQKA